MHSLKEAISAWFTHVLGAFPSIAAFSTALLLAPSVLADDWANLGTGNWFDNGNWSDNSAPTGADTVTIDNGGTAQVQIPGAAANNLRVGFSDGNSGFLEILNGGTVSNAGGDIGYAAGSTGAATVDGANSTWTNTGNLFVGHMGDGALDVTGGGAVNNAGGVIGYIAGSTGEATVDGGCELMALTGLATTAAG